jgi:hypothetical protein
MQFNRALFESIPQIFPQGNCCWEQRGDWCLSDAIEKQFSRASLQHESLMI